MDSENCSAFELSDYIDDIDLIKIYTPQLKSKLDKIIENTDSENKLFFTQNLPYGLVFNYLDQPVINLTPPLTKLNLDEDNISQDGGKNNNNLNNKKSIKKLLLIKKKGKYQNRLNSTKKNYNRKKYYQQNKNILSQKKNNKKRNISKTTEKIIYIGGAIGGSPSSMPSPESVFNLDEINEKLKTFKNILFKFKLHGLSLQDNLDLNDIKNQVSKLIYYIEEKENDTDIRNTFTQKLNNELIRYLPISFQQDYDRYSHFIDIKRNLELNLMNVNQVMKTNMAIQDKFTFKDKFSPEIQQEIDEKYKTLERQKESYIQELANLKDDISRLKEKLIGELKTFKTHLQLFNNHNLPENQLNDNLFINRKNLIYNLSDKYFSFSILNYENINTCQGLSEKKIKDYILKLINPFDKIEDFKASIPNMGRESIDNSNYLYLISNRIREINDLLNKNEKNIKEFKKESSSDSSLLKTQLTKQQYLISP